MESQAFSRNMNQTIATIAFSVDAIPNILIIFFHLFLEMAVSSTRQRQQIIRCVIYVLLFRVRFKQNGFGENLISCIRLKVPFIQKKNCSVHFVFVVSFSFATHVWINEEPHTYIYDFNGNCNSATTLKIIIKMYVRCSVDNPIERKTEK